MVVSIAAAISRLVQSGHDEVTQILAAVECGDRAAADELLPLAGMTIPEAAQAMGVSHATAERHLTFAPAWLHSQLKSRE